jgi:hypothetical protein
MRVDLGDADAAVGIGLGVVTDFLRELQRIGKLPDRHEFDRDLGGGQIVRVTVLLQTPTFAMITTGPDSPRTVLRLTGTVEVRPANDPGATPVTFPLDAAVRLTLVLVPGTTADEVALRYDGVEGTPAPPVTAADVDGFMRTSEVQQVLDSTRLPFAASLVAGLNPSRFPEAATRPPDSDWAVRLTLTPAAGSETVDAFVVSAGPPGTTATLGISESFMAPRTGLAVAYGRAFLDEMLARAAAVRVGTTVAGARITSLSMAMADSGIDITGHVVRPVTALPDVDIDFDGIAVPRLVRGTTAMTMDTSGIDVDVDDTDEIFYGALQWLLTIGSMALLLTGVGSLTALGILSWLTLVQFAWNGAVELDNAPNVLRDTLAAVIGAKLSLLADSLDDSTATGELTVDGSPDSAVVVDGSMVLYAQVIIASIRRRLRSAEYSRKLGRFAIFVLEDRRRFRAQELARLMAAGKIEVSGFHHVNGDYVRSDHDNLTANNLLQSFENNETLEVVAANV